MKWKLWAWMILWKSGSRSFRRGFWIVVASFMMFAQFEIAVAQTLPPRINRSPRDLARVFV
jgi:hypothetical protein